MGLFIAQIWNCPEVLISTQNTNNHFADCQVRLSFAGVQLIHVTFIGLSLAATKTHTLS